MIIKPIQYDHAELANILEKSDQLMADLYPAESNHMEPIEAFQKNNMMLLGCFIDSTLAGTGAVKMFNNESNADNHYAEIKRVYVLEEFRGLGLSKKIMFALHDYLLSQNIFTSKLETGIKQPEAIGLYRALGYKNVGPFGDYNEDPLSLFMQLDLKKPQ
ncbi:GNAT family N-acetyltransferase [Marinicellulosiphila megalodicopiae]|uniref:GNAT family N-acetyltransferase n=1 Tax=Marinicellulosiphila megalodicopiae TaxID=2724896 RepID=UPI003BAE8E01